MASGSLSDTYVYVLLVVWPLIERCLLIASLSGPLAPIVSFTNEDEVVAMANDTEAGLAAYLYTKDLGTVRTNGHGFGVCEILP